MNVHQVMTKNAETCQPQDSLSRAAEIMWDHDCGCVPVVDDGGRVVSMITDRDICMAAFTRGIPLYALPVADAMSKNIVACRPDDQISYAQNLMQTNGVRRLPVVDEERRLVGILSLNDIAREGARGRGLKTGQIMLDEISLTLAAVGRPRFSRGADSRSL